MELAISLKQLREFVGEKPWDTGYTFLLDDEPRSTKEPCEPPLLKPVLSERTEVNFRKLLREAHGGDESAIMRLAIHTRALCNELAIVCREHPDLARKVGQTFSDWPLNVSPSQTLPDALRQALSTLGIGGEYAFLPAYPGKRVDTSNLWTRYALAALKCLRLNRAKVPILLAKAEAAKATRVHECNECEQVFRTTFYDMGDTIVAVEDWQRLCVDLPERPTKDNTPKFMAPAKLAIRQFWRLNPDAFAEVRVKVEPSVRYATDGQFIDRALAKIEQAMRGLAHK